MHKYSKLFINPEDSNNETFTLSLMDYFYKELLHRGIHAQKKSAYLQIDLPKKYENKYNCLVIDCTNGKVYLRGEEQKDKHFGKLSKFNPQRKSDAYNCVNYNVTRLVNRINKLIKSMQEIKTASYEIMDLRDYDLGLCECDAMDLRDCDLVVIVIDDCCDLRDFDCYSIDKIAKAEYKHYFPSNQSELDKFLKDNPDIAERQNELGKLTNVYENDMIATFEKEVDFDEDTVIEWCTLWSNVIKRKFEKYMKDDVTYELEPEYATITVWVDNLSDYLSGYSNVPGKLFFKVRMTGMQVSDMDLNTKNITRVDYHPDDEGITFDFVGEKY